MASAAGPDEPDDTDPDGTVPDPTGPGVPRRADASSTGPGAPATDAADRWLAAARADEAARVRSRRASLVRQQAEEATVLGVLTDLAERQDLTSLVLVGDRRRTGWVTWVGTDAVVVEAAGTPMTVVPIRAVVAVSVAGRSLPPSPGATVAATDLHGLLSGVAGGGVRGTVRAGGTHETGDLHHVGLDVVSLRRDDRSVVHLALGAIDEVVLLDDPWSGGAG